MTEKLSPPTYPKQAHCLSTIPPRTPSGIKIKYCLKFWIKPQPTLSSNQRNKQERNMLIILGIMKQWLAK